MTSVDETGRFYGKKKFSELFPEHLARASKLRGAMAPARNDPCPCGSAKKYKKCCAGKATVGKNDARHEEWEYPDTDLAKVDGIWNSPIRGEQVYWSEGVSRRRVHQRLFVSFGLRCGDEYHTTGTAIGAYAAAANGETSFVPSDEKSGSPSTIETRFDTACKSRVMHELKAYLEMAKAKNVLPGGWNNADLGDTTCTVDDRGVLALGAFPSVTNRVYATTIEMSGVARQIEKADINDKFGALSGEVEILRRIVEDVLGDGVDSVEGGTWVVVASDSDENENERRNEDRACGQYKECEVCGVHEREGGGGKPCFKCKCKLVYYCSTECQTEDWRDHKPFCKKARAGSKITSKRRDMLEHFTILVYRALPESTYQPPPLSYW